LTHAPEAPAGFEGFVRENAPWLTRSAAILVLGADQRSDAQDIVQETFVILFRRWPHLKASQAASAFAYKTMVRLIRRHSSGWNVRLGWPALHRTLVLVTNPSSWTRP
jgi:DNA-directed RNA polymerase specialized sigma24 family protein